MEKAEKLYIKKRLDGPIRFKLSELKGVFNSHAEYEDIVSSSFKSCKNIEQLTTEREIFISDLKSTANIICEDIREDMAKSTPIFANSTSMSEAEVENLSLDLMTHLGYQRMMEGDILRYRSELVNTIFDTHRIRISEFNGSFPFADLELEEFEQLLEMDGSEKEGSVMQDSNKGKHKQTDNNNDKGKGKAKAEDTEDNNDKGEGKAEDPELRFYEDTLKAMKISKNYKNSEDSDDSKNYEPESSKRRKLSKK